ncbi:hypothetical protein [Flammeovirga aprica]|uniref:hypothetical protein n=1 Tax=Flammeovirga aprica TaxID=29528 RepID=UPI00197F5D21|nr:hypothetical protein [Flammeovirga aprica]
MFGLIGCSKEHDIQLKPGVDDNFNLTSASAIYNSDLEQVVMSMEVQGLAGGTTPTPLGQLDGASVFGYVFPTTLKSNDVGFGITEGIVAMALSGIHTGFY